MAGSGLSLVLAALFRRDAVRSRPQFIALRRRSLIEHAYWMVRQRHSANSSHNCTGIAQ